MSFMKVIQVYIWDLRVKGVSAGLKKGKVCDKHSAVIVLAAKNLSHSQCLEWLQN